MPAIKKTEDESGLHDTAPEAVERPVVAESPVAFDETQDPVSVQPVESPALSLQQRLHDALQAEKRRELMWDVGRVLASASGITTLLGVFFYYGIW